MERARSTRTKAMVAAALVATAALAAGAVWAGMSYARAPRLGDATPGNGGWVREPTPRIAIDVGNGDAISSYDVRLDGIAVDDNAHLEGNRIVVEGVPLEDGRHTIVVQAHGTGLFGGEMHKTWNFSVDTRPPGLRVDTPLKGFIRWNA